MKYSFGLVIVVVSLLVAAQNSSEAKSPTSGQKNELVSYAVTSCGASAISLSNFRMVYHRFDHTVDFSMIGTAQEDGFVPIMVVDVSSYGAKLPALSINLCEFSHCPLSQNSIFIQNSTVLKESYTNTFPSTFWTLPLDVSLKLTFVDSSGGGQIGCLTAKLYNGVTTNSITVAWVTGLATVGLLVVTVILEVAGAPGSTGVAGGAGATSSAGTVSGVGTEGLLPPGAVSSGGASSIVPGNAGSAPNAVHTTLVTTTPAGHAGPPAGDMDPITLFLHFQTISSSGLLSLDYPSFYQGFTTNFAWANLIIPLRAFREAAAQMRKCNINNNDSIIPAVNSGSDLSLSSGIATYSSHLGVDSQDLFGIIYLVFLCACAVLLAIHLIASAFVYVAYLSSTSNEDKLKWERRRKRLTGMASNNSLRLIMVALGTLSTFSFYQWTLQCTSTLTFFLSCSAFALSIFTLGTISFFILRTAKRPGGADNLFTKDSKYERRWSSMYNTLRKGHLRFVVTSWVVVVSRSAIIAFGQSNGFVQVIAMIALQFVACIGIFLYHPYNSRGFNRVNYLIYLMEGNKFVSYALLLVFVDRLHIGPTATTIIGFVLLVIYSIMALILVGLSVLKLGWGWLWCRRKNPALDRRPRSQATQYSYYDHTMSPVEERRLTTMTI